MTEMAEETCGKKEPLWRGTFIDRSFEGRAEMFKGDLEKDGLIGSVESKPLFLSMKHSVNSECLELNLS